MLYLILKAALSGIIVMAVSEIARRSPTFGGLIASLPLVSLLGIIWLWRDGVDSARIAAHAELTFWFVLPSLPMFLLVPYLLRLDLMARAGCGLPLDIRAVSVDGVALGALRHRDVIGDVIGDVMAK